MAFKLENGNVAPALYLGGSVLATEQFSIIRDKRHRTVHSDKKKGGGGMIAGLPVCHLPTKSSPSRPTTVLSDLIMLRIKSKEEKRGTVLNPGPLWRHIVTNSDSDDFFPTSWLCAKWLSFGQNSNKIKIYARNGAQQMSQTFIFSLLLTLFRAFLLRLSSFKEHPKGMGCLIGHV